MEKRRACRLPHDDSLFDLTGQVAIVTGTSRGLGQYFARALAKAGADLVLTSRNRDIAARFRGGNQSLGRRSVALELDVRDHGQHPEDGGGGAKQLSVRFTFS